MGGVLWKGDLAGCDAGYSTVKSYIEHAEPMTFVGENPGSKSYVIGMTCTRGRFSILGMYKAENGKFTDLSTQ